MELEVIDWLSKQAWSNGNVGMMGISWGGFNAIQMAQRHPPALKAIIAVCATEELFHDDIHYIDGLMHVDEFEPAMDLELGLTRSPDFPTDEKSLALRFDSFSMVSAVSAPATRRPVLAAGFGGAESLRRVHRSVIYDWRFSRRLSRQHAAIFRKFKAPIKAMLGPWNHTFPHDAEPGPAIEWREEATRWWDYWLKGKQNGIMDEPRFEVYMRPLVPARSRISKKFLASGARKKHGRRARPANGNIFSQQDHSLGTKHLPVTRTQSRHELKYVPSIGGEAGFWWGDFATDQRPD